RNPSVGAVEPDPPAVDPYARHAAAGDLLRPHASGTPASEPHADPVLPRPGESSTGWCSDADGADLQCKTRRPVGAARIKRARCARLQPGAFLSYALRPNARQTSGKETA